MSGTEREPIGAILAGGLGQRIGGAKAVVALRGRPLIHYPLAAMQAVLDDTLVLVKPDTKLPSLPGATVWIESDARRHPLFGITEALAAAGGRPVVVCAADLPFVGPDLIARLARAVPGSAPAIVARCGDVIQPLLGRYEAAAMPLLSRALDDGEPRMLEVVENIGARYLEVSDPQQLFNVNAPEDVLQASALMDARRATRT